MSGRNWDRVRRESKERRHGIEYYGEDNPRLGLHFTPPSIPTKSELKRQKNSKGRSVTQQQTKPPIKPLNRVAAPKAALIPSRPLSEHERQLRKQQAATSVPDIYRAANIEGPQGTIAQVAPTVQPVRKDAPIPDAANPLTENDFRDKAWQLFLELKSAKKKTFNEDILHMLSDSDLQSCSNLCRTAFARFQNEQKRRRRLNRATTGSQQIPEQPPAPDANRAAVPTT